MTRLVPLKAALRVAELVKPPCPRRTEGSRPKTRRQTAERKAVLYSVFINANCELSFTYGSLSTGWARNSSHFSSRLLAMRVYGSPPLEHSKQTSLQKGFSTMKTLRFMGVVTGSLACFLSIAANSSFGDTSTSPTATDTTVPVVTIRATDPQATWGGDPVSSLFSGTAIRRRRCTSIMKSAAPPSTARTTRRIGNWVDIPSGVRFGEIIIMPSNLDPVGDEDRHPDPYQLPPDGADARELHHRLPQPGHRLYRPGPAYQCPASGRHCPPSRWRSLLHPGEHPDRCLRPRPGRLGQGRGVLRR